jgi:phage minor structural protein
MHMEKNGMTFASINGNKEYVEDYSYSSEVRVATLDASSFSNPYQMLEFANMRLAQYSKPRISYVLSAMDLSVLTGYEHEAWNLGDIVTVDDKDLNLSVKTRVGAQAVQSTRAMENSAGAIHHLKRIRGCICWVG